MTRSGLGYYKYKESRAVGPGLHVDDREAQGVGDLAGRETLDVAQHNDRAVIDRQRSDGRRQRLPQLRLERGVLHARGPIRFAAAIVVEHGGKLVERDIGTSSTDLLTGPVRDDPVQRDRWVLGRERDPVQDVWSGLERPRSSVDVGQHVVLERQQHERIVRVQELTHRRHVGAPLRGLGVPGKHDHDLPSIRVGRDLTRALVVDPRMRR